MEQHWKAKRNPNSAYIYAGVQEGMRAATSWEQGQENEKQRRQMADKLTELFEAAQKTNPNVSDFVSFQTGFSMAAVSMRTRAMAEVDKTKDLNKIKNGIGSLSDIPA